MAWLFSDYPLYTSRAIKRKYVKRRSYLRKLQTQMEIVKHFHFMPHSIYMYSISKQFNKTCLFKRKPAWSQRGYDHFSSERHKIFPYIPFEMRSQNCEKLLLPSSCLSVRPHGITRLPLDGFSLTMTFEYFSKIYRENSSLTTIWQD